MLSPRNKRFWTVRWTALTTPRGVPMYPLERALSASARSCFARSRRASPGDLRAGEMGWKLPSLRGKPKSTHFTRLKTMPVLVLTSSSETVKVLRSA